MEGRGERRGEVEGRGWFEVEASFADEFEERSTEEIGSELKVEAESSFRFEDVFLRGIEGEPLG